MINSKFKTVFGRWSDENKQKVIEAIGDDEMKSIVTYDKPRAFELFKERLNEEYFNEAFAVYYKPIREALDAKKASVKKRAPKVSPSRVAEIDNAIKTLQEQIARLQIERTKAVDAEKMKAVNEVMKMIEKFSPEQRASLMESLNA
jgi:uncharacterized small protein (DUF1192 family)